MAFDVEGDPGLRTIDGSHLFRVSTTQIGLCRDAFPRASTFDVIERFAPCLCRKAVEPVLADIPAATVADSYQIYQRRSGLLRPGRTGFMLMA